MPEAPIVFNQYPHHKVPVGRPVLCRGRNEPVPYMAVLDKENSPTMTVLGLRGKRTEQLAHMSGLVSWADVCPGVYERCEWVTPAT